MTPFLTVSSDSRKAELLIDTKLFSPEIAMKAAYVLLDRAYFFFLTSADGLIVQITPKEGQEWNAETFAREYSDDLLAYALRVRVELENKEVRETIVRRALGSYADLPNFTSVEPEVNSAQIDFDQDIDEILKQIDNDPDLKIDEAEISRILAEIEVETQTHKKPKLDFNKLKDVKKSFQHT